MKLVALWLVVLLALFVAVELTPVPVMDAVVALTRTDELDTPVPVNRELVVFAEIDTDPRAVLVALLVIGAECVWTTAEPLVVQVVV